MPIEIRWTETDPESGEKRIILAEKFAKQWTFKYRIHRRDDWTKGLQPTRAMWEHVLDALKRKYHRRDGVSEEDITQVERILRDLPVPRALEE